MRQILNQSAINGEDQGGELCSGNLLQKGHAGEDGQILTSTKPLTFPNSSYFARWCFPSWTKIHIEPAADTSFPWLPS